MKNNKKSLYLISICILCVVGIGLGAFVNYLFPLNFSVYFFICILSLLLCKLINDEVKLIIPWTITAVASVIVTLNYLHPDISVYTNADYHTLVMQGVDQKDSIVLIGKNKAISFYDKEDLEGNVYITHSGSNSSNCVLHYNLGGEALFAAVENSRTGRLINKEQMPSFRHQITIQNDSIRCDITIREISGEKDSTVILVKFDPITADTIYRPSFWQPINIGYNFYDILHSGISYENASEEALLSALRKSVLVRNYDDKAEGIYYLTFPRDLEKLRIICDGQPFHAPKTLQTIELGKDTYFYMGIGSQATRPMKATSDGGNICLRYQFPYINKFPKASDDPNFKENGQKTLAVTTKTSSLLKTNVKEAFYYPLFEREDNKYNFNGFINYRINNSQTPFAAKLIDERQKGSASDNTLSAKNGAVWHFSICNLRHNSPITGDENIYVKDSTILGMIFIMLMIAFLCSMLLSNTRRSKIIMLVSLFVIPLFVMRIYLLWRIAVFPPVTDITLNEFLRYRMELPNRYENPVLITLLLWIIPFAILVFIKIKCAIELFVIWLKNWWPDYLKLSDGLHLSRVNVFEELQLFWIDRKHIIYYALLLVTSIAIALLVKITHTNNVGLNILIPVVLFLVNEYIVARWLTVWYRIGNALVAIAVLLLNDPGYAIMFFIFESIYYAIILYAYLRSRWRDYSSGKAAGFIFMLFLILLVALIVILPKMASYAYSNEPSFLGFICISRLVLIVIPLVVGSILLGVTWRWKRFKLKWGGIIGIVTLIIVISLSATLGYDYLHNHNLHFKYRTIIHTKTVGEIMQDEKYDDDDSQRLLNAAQNQWFLQYHINKGEERVTDDGILSLLPHFKKGVTWNTQISDVILSRYVIGELSGAVPLLMIFLSLAFLWIIFRNENLSPAGRALTYAIALLFLVQCTFEWMAVTNRTIFFGQDFPFLSQNARATLVMFEIWLILLVIFACYVPEYENNDELGDGLDYFTKTIPQAVFFVLFAVVTGTIFVCGNKYEELYAQEKSEGDRSNAEQFNISTAMNKSEEELADINSCLAEYPVTGKKLENNEDISSLVKDIEDKIQLSTHVETMKEKGQINDFTYSLYQAFIKNLKRNNSNSNIIHLRHHNMMCYELALNRSYFSLQSPDYDKNAWKGNIYSDIAFNNQNSSLPIKELPGMIVYSIPASWLPANTDYAIVDCRMKDGHIGENYKKFIHKEMADYTASTAVFPISPNDVLELNDKRKNDVLTYQYGREEQTLLVKNMVINGKRKFFYPLKEKCLWLRDFSNLVAYSKHGSGSRDSVFVTLDSKLTETLSGLLQRTNHECSVVVMDGWGNVRLMADNKKSGAIDPNNEELINELIVQSYMNPNPETDQNMFGNLNLCYMKPGPGSSLKPITYAAVTSQSQDINWSELELMSPSQVKDTTVSKVVGKYYHVRKFGPQYKYSAKRPFKSITNDEKGIDENGIGWINNAFYLYQSSNYYNALITYLGHYESLRNAEEDIFILSTTVNDFPRFKTRKGGKVYTFRDAPHAKGNQILFDGLTTNFKVPTYTGYADTLRYEFINSVYYKENNVKSKSKLASRSSWVFPQASSIYDYEMQVSELTPAERLRQYTLGSDPIKVTPIKMAEMYGKLYSLHPDFHASIIPRTTGFTELWLDRNGIPSDKFFNFYRENIYKGMEECAEIGTARFLTKEVKGYHLYAKTGTLSLRDGIFDDRMLAVVISNKRLVDNKDIKSPDDYKYMVVYFRFKQLDPESGLFWNTVNTVIKEIVNSTSFNNYMKYEN